MAEAFLSAALVVLAGSASATDTALFERTFMLEADRRCVLFTPAVRNSLQAGAAQARGAAKRAGGSPPSVEVRARTRAQATACRSPDLAVAAGRVRSAHEGWVRVQRLEFPGTAAGWRADRTPTASLRWRLVQTRPQATFGLAAGPTGPLHPYAVARFPKQRTPSLARLTIGRRVFLAETNLPAPEGLRPAGRGAPARAFRFSPAALAALDAAAPDDAVRLDFLARGRSGRTTTVLIERGDYAAARAFLRL